MKDLVHQDEVELAVGQLFEEGRAEVDTHAVRRRRLAGGVERELHMHEKKSVESVLKKDPHARLEKPADILSLLIFRQLH